MTERSSELVRLSSELVQDVGYAVRTLRREGKTYVVQDGDIIEFLFNV